jgi:hypothetical protein
MARQRPTRATLYDFRDLDLMLRIDEEVNGHQPGIASSDLADSLGFEEGDNRAVGIRLAWMRRYGMVAYDEREKLWSLSPGGRRVTQAHLRAPALRVVESMPDEAAVEMMAHVVSRYQRGDAMIAHMLRREFLYGTKPR